MEGKVVVGDGVMLGGEAFGRGEQVECEVRPSDGVSEGEVGRVLGRAVRLRRLKDWGLSNMGSHPGQVFEFKGRGYFFAKDSAHGRELWVSDGTLEGTTLFKELWPGPLSEEKGASWSGKVVGAGDLFYFLAEDGTGDRKVWMSDGTREGTRIWRDVGPESEWRLGIFDGDERRVYASRHGQGTEVWMTRPGDAISGSLRLVWSGPGTRFIQVLGVLEGKTYFSMRQGSMPPELWVTQGDVESTTMLAHLDPKDLSERFLVHQAAGKVYFPGQDKAHGTEWWASDGTPEGTKMLGDIRPGVGSGFPGTPQGERLKKVGRRVYFTANDGVHGTEWWVSDGTPEGTKMLLDAGVGIRHGAPVASGFSLGDTFFFHVSPITWRQRELWVDKGVGQEVRRFMARHVSRWAVLGDRAVFTVEHDLADLEVWVSDGTGEGTMLLQVIKTNGPVSSHLLGVFQGHVYVIVSGADKGRELWRSDGTSDGTRRLGALPEKTTLHDVIGETATHVMFRLKGINDAFHLWAIGFADATLVDVGGGALKVAQDLMIHQDALFFLREQSEKGMLRELWVTDGTAGGTRKLQGLPDDSGTLAPRFLGVVGAQMFFAVQTHTTGEELWITDGSPLGTIYKEINESFQGSLQVFGQDEVNTYFILRTPPLSSYWVTDGDAVEPLPDFAPEDHVTQEQRLRAYRGKPYFFAKTISASDRELWLGGPGGQPPRAFKTDGGGRLTRFSGDHFFEFEGAYHFVASEGDYGGLWRTDGTQEGTRPVRVFGRGSPAVSFAGEAAGGFVFFTRERREYSSVWWSDGTLKGTVMIETFWGSDVMASPEYIEFAAHQGKYFFPKGKKGRGGVSVTDGTPKGTHVLLDDGEQVDLKGQHLSVGELFYFVSRDRRRRQTLWASDGTPGGTRALKELDPEEEGIGQILLSQGVGHKGRLYVVVHAGDGAQVWRSDGTKEGTVELKGFDPGLKVTTLINFRHLAGEELFIVVNDHDAGRKVWVTNAKSLGVTPVPADPFLMMASGTQKAALSYGGSSYFAAHDADHGRELWVSDGTEEGERLFEDFWPGVASSMPSVFKSHHADGSLYLTTSDGSPGPVLWVLE